MYAALRRFQLLRHLDSRPAKRLLLLFDSAGTSVFICAGVEAAISCSTGSGVILLSGVLTAIGGGIWASFVAGQSPQTVLQSAIGYRFIVLCLSTAYTFGHLNFLRNTEILDLSLVAVCIVCCYARCMILESTVMSQQKNLQQKRRMPSRKALFLQSRSQLFWSVVNPLCGMRTYRIFRSPRGKRMVICSVIYWWHNQYQRTQFATFCLSGRVSILIHTTSSSYYGKFTWWNNSVDHFALNIQRSYWLHRFIDIMLQDIPVKIKSRVYRCEPPVVNIVVLEIGVAHIQLIIWLSSPLMDSPSSKKENQFFPNVRKVYSTNVNRWAM